MDEMRVYLTNLGKYNEGEQVGAWFTFPIDYDDVKERIGLNESYEGYAVHDYEFPCELSEYSSIDELNRKAQIINELPLKIVENLSTLLEYYNFDEILEKQGDFVYYSVDSFKELAYQFVEDGAFGELPSLVLPYFNYDAYARDLELSPEFIKGKHGIFEKLR